MKRYANGYARNNEEWAQASKRAMLSTQKQAQQLVNAIDSFRSNMEEFRRDEGFVVEQYVDRAEYAKLAAVADMLDDLIHNLDREV